MLMFLLTFFPPPEAMIQMSSPSIPGVTEEGLNNKQTAGFWEDWHLAVGMETMKDGWFEGFSHR